MCIRFCIPLLSLLALLALSRPAAAGVNIWAAGSTEKIQHHNRAALPHDRVWNAATRTVKISGVRGEHVPFQVIVSADSAQVSGVVLKATVLRNGTHILAAENIHLYFVHAVMVYAPTGEHGRTGRWPDALVPLTRPFNIRSDGRNGPRHQSVWVDMAIPRDQQPGTYRGNVTISSDRGELGTVNIELTVHDVTLPAERHFPAHVGLYEHHIARMHGVDQDSAEFREIFTQYLSFLLENRLDPRTPPGLRGRLEQGKYVVEWPWPELEQLFIEKGRTQFLIRPLLRGIPEQGREGPFTEEYKGYIRAYVRQVIARAKQNGWYDRLVFLSPIDEPKTAKQYEAVRRWAEVMRGVDPDVPMAVTEQPFPENPDWGTLVGHVNAWIVNGNYLFAGAEAVDNRRRAGDMLTWYISCDQLYPQPNYYIDREAADPRMVPWITWRYGLGGILYWTATFWEEIKDPWIDPITWKWFPCNSPAAGEGSLVYPGHLVQRYTRQDNVKGPVGSIRLALLREGLEELELLRLLDEIGGQAAADEIVASICRNIRDFTRDPNAIDTARDRVIEEILIRSQ